MFCEGPEGREAEERVESGSLLGNSETQGLNISKSSYTIAFQYPGNGHYNISIPLVALKLIFCHEWDFLLIAFFSIPAVEREINLYESV